MDGSESGILKPGSGSAKKSESIRIRIRNTDLNKKLIFYTVPVVCCTCPPIGRLVPGGTKYLVEPVNCYGITYASLPPSPPLMSSRLPLLSTPAPQTIHTCN